MTSLTLQLSIPKAATESRPARNRSWRDLVPPVVRKVNDIENFESNSVMEMLGENLTLFDSANKSDIF
jgi:hypothetical protein